jgi:hypothetical protein
MTVEVPTVVTVKITVFWDVMAYCLVDRSRRLLAFYDEDGGNTFA